MNPRCTFIHFYAHNTTCARTRTRRNTARTLPLLAHARPAHSQTVYIHVHGASTHAQETDPRVYRKYIRLLYLVQNLCATSVGLHIT